MRNKYRPLATLLFAAFLALPVLLGGCADHAGARVYDPYYSDYHTWNHDEVVFYNRWEGETHRDHREFGDRSSAEQKEYWDWRHSHH
jgi:hypothetical protein